MSIQQTPVTDSGTTLRTSSSRESTDSDDTIENEYDSSAVAYQFCEFCISRGTPKDTAESVCECTSFKRGTGLGQIPERLDLAMRLAEHAVLDEWAINPDRSDTEITESHVGGGTKSPGENRRHDVRISFEGSIWDEVTEPFTCEYGTAELWAVNGDGDIHVAVTLADEYARD